jgi:NAD(P)-dependent dehydrogenase (short-subunit alcohol dehydrogenase family)
LDLNLEAATTIAKNIEATTGCRSIGLTANVLDRNSLEKARDIILKEMGSIDYLINGAGGNSPAATTEVDQMTSADMGQSAKTFFDLETDGFDKVFDLNFKGTLLPCLVFGAEMVKKSSGAIVNISSMNSYRPLTRIPAYSAAKAAINNFTQWLAVHFAKTGVRVNAIAPGFLLTNQNRFLLVDEKTGEATPRGHKIMDNTPMARYGTPEELSGTLSFLLSDWSKFVTGIVVPVDGGFSAFSGV